MHESETVFIEGRITESEFMSAQRANSFSSAWRTASLEIVGFLSVAGTTAAAILYLKGSLPFSFIWFPAGIGLFIAAVLVFVYFQIRSQYRQTKLMQAPFSAEVSDEGLRCSSEFGDALLPWDVFLYFYETPNLLLLYQSQRSFNIIPKRLFRDQADIDKAVEIVSRNVKRR